MQSPASEVRLEPLEYSFDGLVVTLNSDGNATIHYRDGTTQRIEDHFNAYLMRGLIANTPPSTIDVLWLPRVQFVAQRIVPIIAARVTLEKVETAQVISLARKWAETSVITVRKVGSEVGQSFTFQLSNQQVEELIAALSRVLHEV